MSSYHNLREKCQAPRGRRQMNSENEDIERGYSSESLKMLESEEGQLNAVFACFGSAAQRAQLFEQSLSRFLAMYNKIALGLGEY